MMEKEKCEHMSKTRYLLPLNVIMPPGGDIMIYF